MRKLRQYKSLCAVSPTQWMEKLGLEARSLTPKSRFSTTKVLAVDFIKYTSLSPAFLLDTYGLEKCLKHFYFAYAVRKMFSCLWKEHGNWLYYSPIKTPTQPINVYWNLFLFTKHWVESWENNSEKKIKTVLALVEQSQVQVLRH